MFIATLGKLCLSVILLLCNFPSTCHSCSTQFSCVGAWETVGVPCRLEPETLLGSVDLGVNGFYQA